jgi:glycosyltransferase involved in cell wall biosynthesis
MRIDMFVYNRCTTDARVLKEARTLAAAGHLVRVVAVLDDTTAPREERDGFQIVRIDRDPLHYRVLRAARAGGRLWRRPVGVAKRALVRVAPGLVEGWRELTGRAEASEEAQPPGRGRSRALALALAPLVLLARGLDLAWRGAAAAARRAKRGGRRLILAPHKPLTFLDYYARAYRLVRADPPDALHAHDLNTLPVAAALARRLRLPLTYDAHELYPEISTLSRREAATWRFLERRLAKRADRILTVCDSIAAEIERRYGVARPTVLLNCPAAAGASGGGGGGGANRAAAGNPAEHGAFPVYITGNAPNDRGANGNEPVVLYQGGFVPHRGLDTLIRSAHRLERGTIVLMGWGRLEGELRELIVREQLEHRVRIVGPVPQDEVVAYAAGAAIGVIPYEPVGLNNTYTTPNKLFDYMAAGLPVAASRLPELTRFVERGGIGLTFAPGDPAALGDALAAMLTDPERYGRMRKRAQEAGRRYTWERESQKLLSLYDGA